MLATAPGGHGTQYGVSVEAVDGPDEAPAWVRARKQEGSDWIKIVLEDGGTFGMDIATLGRDTVGALIAAAHAEGLCAVLHVSTLEHALEAVSLGADGLVHVWRDELVDEARAARIAEAGMFVVPTLSVTAAMGGEAMESEMLEAAGGTPVSVMQRQTLASRFSGNDAERAASAGDVAIDNVRRLHAAGVRLLAGTDAPNPGTASGLSLHGELRLLRRAGLSAAEALAAATSAPAAIFGLDDRGVIGEGRIADLVLVDGDLENDLSLSPRIVGVWKDGYPVDRSAVGQEWGQAQPAPPRARDDVDRRFRRRTRPPAFGFGWQVASDRMQGGSSTARLSVESGALRVEGEIVSGFAFPWAGVTYFPGAQPMQPVDFSDREMLRFRVRGDGRTYVAMLFAGGAGCDRASHRGRSRQRPRGPRSRSRSNGFRRRRRASSGGLAFVAQAPRLGPFAFEIDDVEIR